MERIGWIGTVESFAESVVHLGVACLFFAISYWIIKKANHKG